MKTLSMVGAFSVLLAVIAFLVIGGGGAGSTAARGEGAAPAPAPGTGGEDVEVTKDPGALVSPNVRAGNLMVYGVKLGDSVEKIRADAGVTRQPSDRPNDAVYEGPNVIYFTSQGKIYQICVNAELLKQLPPYDTTRLQIALGRADEAVRSNILARPDSEVTSLTYFARRVRFNFIGSKPVESIDLYAP